MHSKADSCLGAYWRDVAESGDSQLINMDHMIMYRSNGGQAVLRLYCK